MKSSQKKDKPENAPAAGKNKKIVQKKSFTPPSTGIEFIAQKKATAQEEKHKVHHLKSKTKKEHEKLHGVLLHQKGAAVNDSVNKKGDIHKNIETEITRLFHEEEKSGNKTPLESLLCEVVDGISPAHIKTGDAPGKSKHINSVAKKHAKAIQELNTLRLHKAGDVSRKKLAYKIAIDCIKSPIHLTTDDIAPKLEAKGKSGVHGGPLKSTSSQLKAKRVSASVKTRGEKKENIGESQINLFLTYFNIAPCTEASSSL